MSTRLKKYNLLRMLEDLKQQQQKQQQEKIMENFTHFIKCWTFKREIIFFSDISGTTFSRGTVFFPYFYALIWSAIPLGGVGSYALESYGTSCTLQWDENRVYITLMSSFCIATPAAVISLTYVFILLKCRKSSRNVRIWKTRAQKMSAKDSYLIKVSEN